MKEPELDIFSGKTERDAIWLESVKGLEVAIARMEQIAAEKPGQYFVFSTASNTVLAKTNGISEAEAKRKVHGGAA